MLIRIPSPHALRDADVTPESVYLNRRAFLTAMGVGGAALAMPALAADAAAASAYAALRVERRQELAGGETVTDFRIASTYNNYYEYGTGKDEPAKNAHKLQTRPWTVAVDGECESPATVDIDSLLNGLEERIYRHRCVEGWSMVVPWVGVPLGSFLKRFKPTAKAKYVAFETLHDPKQMPLARWSGLDLPYVEGLRIDEAMHPLTLLSVGMYGRVLPKQNGAPVRLVVPWKYGFKGIKSIVKIRFTEREPRTTWNLMARNEYGFYSNVNPQVSHPRWSQKTERRLGELFKRDTLMFNGYDDVASLYTGMNLRQKF